MRVADAGRKRLSSLNHARAFLLLLNLVWCSARLLLPTPVRADVPAELDTLNVSFDQPASDASGALPLGNGTLGVSAWFEPSGDLVMYLSSPDSFSGTPNLLKIGRVRVSLAPSALAGGHRFVETLKLRQGRLEADLGNLQWEVFVQADKPIVHVLVRGGESFMATITNEVWRTKPTFAGGWSGFGGKEEPEHIVDAGPAAIASYHRNEKSAALELLRQQSCEDLPGTFDPLKNRTFGLWIEGRELMRINPQALKLKEPTRTFHLSIACPVLVAEAPLRWTEAASLLAHSADNVDQARAGTEAHWREFWDRSWVLPTIAPGEAVGGKVLTPVAQAYALQRYVTGCQGRGEFPIKFNGGIFTVDPTITNPQKTGTPDFREWGDAFWYQNTRHMYMPLLKAGDSDLLPSFFRLYERARPLAEARAKRWYACDGCFFPETMTIFGTYASNDYGRNRAGRKAGDVESPWVGRIWSQGLELVSLMLDYWDWTEDLRFGRQELVPMAESVLRYYDTRFSRDGTGRLLIAPTQVLETYQTGVTNDIVNLAGLASVLQRLHELPTSLLSGTERDFFSRLQKACPPLPTKIMEVGGKELKVLAPAYAYDNKRSNVENPELYAIWPFRLYGIGKPDLELARATYAARQQHLDVGWGYDGNAAAVLGLTNEASRIVLAKCANSHPSHRFPASWGPNFDWLPDMNHGGNLMETLELMLLQADKEHIYVLPAWPRNWDCKFKLHAPAKTTVEGEVKDGKITRLQVSPAARAADVIRCWN